MHDTDGSWASPFGQFARHASTEKVGDKLRHLHAPTFDNPADLRHSERVVMLPRTKPAIVTFETWQRTANMIGRPDHRQG